MPHPDRSSKSDGVECPSHCRPLRRRRQTAEGDYQDGSKARSEQRWNIDVPSRATACARVEPWAGAANGRVKQDRNEKGQKKSADGGRNDEKISNHTLGSIVHSAVSFHARNALRQRSALSEFLTGARPLNAKLCSVTMFISKDCLTCLGHCFLC